jgi:uncharacterized iron-regulated membrane protein
MKKYFRKIHQWLGLISGLLVFIIAITGCIYAFQEEIQDATQPYRFVEKENKAFLLPSQLEQIAKQHLPNKALHSIKYHTENKSAEAIFFHYEPTYYYTIYLNPYSGKILHTQNMEEGFFPFILKGHFYLWLPEKIGQPVVAIASLVFLAMIITGLILWFPKNRNVLKSRTWFRWKDTTKWKRKNFDLHSIIGFYSFFIALIFVVTGLVWGFQWFAYSYYTVIGGKKSLIYEEPKSIKSEIKSKNGLDILYTKLTNETTNLQTIEVHPTETDSSTIAINTNIDAGTFWKTDYRYFDQYTLQERQINNIYSRYHNATLADKLMRMNYDIHTGAVFGLLGKIFMFLLSLLIASLPVTGILFWYGRVRKDRKERLHTITKHSWWL